jgi:hypothetical protein
VEKLYNYSDLNIPSSLIMKTQFFLMLLTFNGLLLCAHSASASAATTSVQVAHLSQTIANLINFDDRNLLKQAIDRALLAQNSREDNSSPNAAGGEPVVQPSSTDPQPIINGKIANPNPKYGEGRPRRRPTTTPPVASPNEPPVLINGIILRK